MDDTAAGEFLEAIRLASGTGDVISAFSQALKTYGFDRWSYRLSDNRTSEGKSALRSIKVPPEDFNPAGLPQTTSDNPADDKNHGHSSCVDISLNIPESLQARVTLWSSTIHPCDIDLHTQKHVRSLHYLSFILHLKLQQFPPAPRVSKPRTGKELTRRETECLKWLAEGKTTWDISKILDIRERTVVYHIENAKKKLNAANRTHAVILAMNADLLHKY